MRFPTGLYLPILVAVVIAIPASLLLGSALAQSSDTLAAEFPESDQNSPFHTGPSSVSRLVVTFNRPVADFSQETPSVQVTGGRVSDVLTFSPNPPMGGVNAGQIGMREPAREKAWAPLDRCDPARVFSSRTGPGERSMEAGNRVIVRSDAAGCTRGRGGREFGGVGAVADSAVRRGVEWLAAGPGRC